MRILFLSHYFPPEVNAPATRTYEHCKRWAKAGHEVTVVSCVPHHPMGEAYPGYKNRLFQKEQIDGITAIKVLTYITPNEGFAKRTFNYVFYMVMAIAISPFIGKADVVLSTSPQFFNGLAGYFVSRLKRAPWVLEIRDLWPESILAVGALTNKRAIRALEGVEKFVYRKANHIVSVTDSFKSHIESRGGQAEKISVIKNGVDLGRFEIQEPDQAFAKQYGLGNKFIAAYVGTQGLAHGLDTLLKAAERLQHREDIHIVMVGDGADRKRLEAEAERLGLKNFSSLGQLPKSAMPQLLSNCGANLVLLRKLDLFLSVIPSKIFESMAMQKPLIMGVEGEGRNIVDAAEAGIGITPEDDAALAKAVETLADDRELCKTLGSNGRAYVSEHFNRERLADDYEAVLKRLTRQ